MWSDFAPMCHLLSVTGEMVSMALFGCFPLHFFSLFSLFSKYLNIFYLTLYYIISLEKTVINKSDFVPMCPTSLRCVRRRSDVSDVAPIHSETPPQTSMIHKHWNSVKTKWRLLPDSCSVFTAKLLVDVTRERAYLIACQESTLSRFCKCLHKMMAARKKTPLSLI